MFVLGTAGFLLSCLPYLFVFVQFPPSDLLHIKKEVFIYLEACDIFYSFHRLAWWSWFLFDNRLLFNSDNIVCNLSLK
jgi:hypothetical protein